MNKLFIYFFIFSTLIGHSQNNFEKGYFIDNENNKVDCFIKNLDWLNNPEDIEYKITLEGESTRANVEKIKVFNIINGPKYISQKTSVDISKSTLSELNYERSPLLEEKTIFLKYEVEGDANLYSYVTKEKATFYYNVKDNPIELLTFKEYFNKYRQIVSNLMYKQQLLNSLKCESVTQNDVESLKYKKHLLVKFFRNYNKCADPNYSVKKKESKISNFSLSIRPGFNYAFVQAETTSSIAIKTDFEINPRYGIEFEYVLPFNNNKWGVLIEPTFQEFRSNSGTINSTAATSFDIYVKSLNIPVGFRHYVFLNNRSRLFITGATSFNFLFKNSGLDITFPYTSSHFNTDKGWTSQNFLVGLGYSYNDKINFEIQYKTFLAMNSSTGSGASGSNAYLSSFSFIIGYNLF